MLFLILLASDVTSPEPNIFAQYDGPTVQSGDFVSSVPEYYLGLWVQNEADCRESTAASRLIISPLRLQFPLTEGEVRQVIRHNSRAVTLSVSFVRDGTSWDANERLILDRDAKGLTLGQGRSKYHRVRCALND